MEGIIVEERVEKARSLFASGYNCAQSVALAYADIVEVDDKTIATISASFGGGMGRLREVCGAVSGMSIIVAFLRPANDPADRVAKSANYALVQEFAEDFRARNRYIVCRDLLGLTQPKSEASVTEGEGAPYKKRPCKELVGDAARIVGEWLVKQ